MAPIATNLPNKASARTNGLDSDPDPLLEKGGDQPDGGTPPPGGPDDATPRVLTSQPASAVWIYILIVWAIGGSASMLYLATSIWNATAATSKSLDAAELSLACILGALGGFTHCLQSLGVYVGNRQLLSSWIPYYFFYPMKGSALSFIVILLIKSGLSGPSSTDITGDMIKICAIAALTGLFSNQALQMCGDVFNVVFGKVRAKDNLDENAPKSPPATASSKSITS